MCSWRLGSSLALVFNFLSFFSFFLPSFSLLYVQRTISSSQGSDSGCNHSYLKQEHPFPTGVLVPDWSLFAVKLNNPIISRNFPCFPRDTFCIWVSSLLFRSWVVGVPVWARMRAKPAVGPTRTSHIRRVDQGEAMLIISSIEGTLLSTAGRRG